MERATFEILYKVSERKGIAPLFFPQHTVTYLFQDKDMINTMIHHSDIDGEVRTLEIHGYTSTHN